MRKIIVANTTMEPVKTRLIERLEDYFGTEKIISIDRKYFNDAEGTLKPNHPTKNTHSNYIVYPPGLDFIQSLGISNDVSTLVPQIRAKYVKVNDVSILYESMLF
jgi:hypothetical protein